MPHTILLIDDSATTLDLLADAFRERGHEVVCEMDAISANRHIYRGEVDVILLDVQMPMLSGTEICRILKEKEETRHIPVLFCSDVEEEELDHLVREAGAEGYVSKSWPMNDIVTRVEGSLARAGGGPEV